MNNFLIVNADTDSISFSKPDGSSFSEEEQVKLLNSLNSLYPEKIKWEHDGVYEVICVLKAKNYIKLHEGEIETKGSSMRNPNKELALREFISKVIECIVYDRQQDIIEIYNSYVKEIFNVKDISRWVVKKTITESVLNPKRTNEQKVLDALNGKHVQMGDKFYFYYDKDNNLKLQENWSNDHDPEKLLGKLYNTIKIFKNVYDIDQIPKFHLKSHDIKCKLATLLGNPLPEKVKRTRKKTQHINNLL